MTEEQQARAVEAALGGFDICEVCGSDRVCLWVGQYVEGQWPPSRIRRMVPFCGPRCSDVWHKANPIQIPEVRRRRFPRPRTLERIKGVLGYLFGKKLAPAPSQAAPRDVLSEPFTLRITLP